MEEEISLSFVWDALTPNDGRVLRLFYNNCNGLEMNRLIRAQVGQKFNKKKLKYLGEEQNHSKCEGIMATMAEWQVNICCMAVIDVAWEKSCKESGKENNQQ